MFAAFRSMARRPDGLARDFGSGPIANDNHAGPDASSALPPDAQAVIEPVPRATDRGGRGWRGQGRVRFAPRWRPVADPLTGWTGGGDPLETIELSFSDMETAADYCRRQGDFSIHGAPGRQHPIPSRLPREPTRYCAAGRQVRTRDAAAGIRPRLIGPWAREAPLASGGMAFSHSP